MATEQSCAGGRVDRFLRIIDALGLPSSGGAEACLDSEGGAVGREAVREAKGALEGRGCVVRVRWRRVGDAYWRLCELLYQRERARKACGRGREGLGSDKAIQAAWTASCLWEDPEEAVRWLRGLMAEGFDLKLGESGRWWRKRPDPPWPFDEDDFLSRGTPEEESGKVRPKRPKRRVRESGAFDFGGSAYR